MGPYGGYLIPEDSDKADDGGTADGKSGGVGEADVDEESEEEKAKSSAVTLPYVAQENLELLTVDLVERCLDSTYKGGDLLGQHPETGEDVRNGPTLSCTLKRCVRRRCTRIHHRFFSCVVSVVVG